MTLHHAVQAERTEGVLGGGENIVSNVQRKWVRVPVREITIAPHRTDETLITSIRQHESVATSLFTSQQAEV